MITNRFISSIFLILIIHTVDISANDNFPHREEYHDVPIIGISEIKQNFDNFFIVDVRSKLEFDVLHMSGATNIPMSNINFEKAVESAHSKSITIVTYCNGHTCKKSYQAARRLIAAGLTNVAAFDAGIFDWIQEAPSKTVLLGRNPAHIQDIILEPELQNRLLPSKKFFADSAIDKALLIDVREPIQRRASKPIPGSRQIPIDQFKKVLNAGTLDGYNLYIVDAVGKQVRWLQYYLKEIGFQNYYFLEGGSESL